MKPALQATRLSCEQRLGRRRRAAGLARTVIREGGNVVWQDGAFSPCMHGIAAACAEADYVTFEVGSGDYQFQAAAHCRDVDEDAAGC